MRADFEKGTKVCSMCKKELPLNMFWKCKTNNAHGLMTWYDGKIDHLNSIEYNKVYKREYCRQRACAINGYEGKKQPSKHFLFDFDLEQMLKDNVYVMTGGKKKNITKWWDGEIRHWTVNDGIWKK